ncbi:hypothetical protein NPIL_324401 [Nephila pilipes]|uniref:Uncharacterized protein n=1 Tax=Nephila pilipes TaxID=299642 RepID=A0A8X6UC46_NEPPI|nr:hypothetical protein NPIL_324401 [Nephila pilipes]
MFSLAVTASSKPSSKKSKIKLGSEIQYENFGRNGKALIPPFMGIHLIRELHSLKFPDPHLELVQTSFHGQGGGMTVEILAALREQMRSPA